MNEEYKRVCECCGRLVFEPDATMTKAGFVCDTCRGEYDRCSVCGDLVQIDALIDVQGEASVCEDCIATPSFRECLGCGELTFVDDLVDGLCPYCVVFEEEYEEPENA